MAKIAAIDQLIKKQKKKVEHVVLKKSNISKQSNKQKTLKDIETARRAWRPLSGPAAADDLRLAAGGSAEAPSPKTKDFRYHWRPQAGPLAF